MSAAEAVAHEPSSLTAIVAHLAHLLPEQAPLHAFVHHNTLHAFEHLPFDQAVVEGGRIFGTQPYQTEAAFAAHLASGRIQGRDLDAILDADPHTDDAPIFPDGPSRRAYRALRLRHLFEIPEGASLEWLLREGDASRRPYARLSPERLAALHVTARRAHGAHTSADPLADLLETLLSRLRAAAPGQDPSAVGPRRRDQLLALHDFDTDALVHPLLIRLCAAFLDQGVAYWQMPFRELGLLQAFRKLYGLGAGPPERWMRGLSAELSRQQRAGLDAEQTVQWALDALAVGGVEREAFLRDTLLSLRGWAGMVRHLEERPDRAPVQAPPARLMDFLAVQLTLDVFAARHALAEHAPHQHLDGLAAAIRGAPLRPRTGLAYEAFVMAQLCDVDLLRFAEPSSARAFVEATREFDDIERRRLLHLAYERRHRVDVLDGLAIHSRMPHADPPLPAFQAVFCLDDRQESLRRQLEECFPAAETFGYAGFFGVAMAYQGLQDVRPRPLCPVVVQPKHLVCERPLDAAEGERYRALLQRRGVRAHATSVGSRTLTRGGLLSAGFGMLSVVPLIGRSLFPLLSERIAHRFAHAHEPPPTRLALERSAGAGADANGLLPGYTVAEMVPIVESALRTMALQPERSPLVLIVGHGSSSLNNPHEAAYDCGATGGGRGGPNARAFAAMANHPGVRAALRERGLVVPDTTHFVGSSHDTSDDSMTYYDEDLVPEALRGPFAAVRDAMYRACQLDAHERCRRFASVPTDIDPEEGLAHAEARAIDLAQPRPECGHATNAVCIVGRRARTRGLFLDRRAFLVSYDPTEDPDGARLTALLLAVGPVGAGINLEYLFSFIDPVGYGCGTKLPHNIVGLLGVMDGHASDLRTGLPWQMVELHEPVRLLIIVEVECALLDRILGAQPDLAALVRNGWVQLVAHSPDSDALHVYERGAFHPYTPERARIPVVQHSPDHYRGQRGHLGCAHVSAAFGSVAP